MATEKEEGADDITSTASTEKKGESANDKLKNKLLSKAEKKKAKQEAKAAAKLAGKKGHPKHERMSTTFDYQFTPAELEEKGQSSSRREWKRKKRRNPSLPISKLRSRCDHRRNKSRCICNEP